MSAASDSRGRRVPWVKLAIWSSTFLYAMYTCHQGSGGEAVLLLLISVTLTLVLMAAAAAASLLDMTLPKEKRSGRWAKALGGSALWLLSWGLATSMAGERLRLVPFDRAAQDAEPLVEAIHEYDRQHGSPPDSLADLVPEFISEVPGTGIPAFPKFSYERAAERRDLEPTWLLYVSCYEGLLQSDVFLCYGDEDYSTAGPQWGGVVERLGRWAYVHE